MESAVGGGGDELTRVEGGRRDYWWGIEVCGWGGSRGGGDGGGDFGWGRWRVRCRKGERVVNERGKKKKKAVPGKERRGFWMTGLAWWGYWMIGWLDGEGCG